VGLRPCKHQQAEQPDIRASVHHNVARADADSMAEVNAINENLSSAKGAVTMRP
jgi:hypothetical protein